MGLLSNNWEQFICNANDYDLRALELISNIEDQTNYRDFNIQIIDRFINDEYKVADLSSFSICASKAYSILQELQAIKLKSEEEFVDVKKLINGICRLNHQGQAQKSYIYLKHALQTYPMELKKHWELFMLALSATSYKKTIIINLLSDVKKRKIEIEEIKLWLPVFHFYDDLAVYYYLLAARYALERKKEEATEAFSYILDKNALPREWREDVKNLDSYLLGKLHYFSMVNNSTLQTLAIEKDAEAVSFINMFLSKDEIGISKAVSAYKAILNAETENLVKLSSYKQLFSFVKKPDDLFDIYRQVESKVPNGNKSRLSYNELLIEYGCLLICIEDGISMDTRMQILLDVFEVFEFLNEINKSNPLILERMSEAEQSVLEKPGVAFDRCKKYGNELLRLLNVSSSDINFNFFAKDYFSGHTADWSEQIDEYFRRYIYTAHSRMESCEEISSKRFGQIPVVRNSYACDRDRRISNNRVLDRLLDTNRVDHYVQHVPVWEAQYRKEEIHDMQKGICLVQADTFEGYVDLRR